MKSRTALKDIRKDILPKTKDTSVRKTEIVDDFKESLDNLINVIDRIENILE